MPSKLLPVVVLIVFLGGCSSIESLYARYSYEFHQHKNEERIHYESGMEELARLAMEYLDKSGSEVAEVEYVPFKNFSRINVYIFSDYERYAVYSNTNGGRAGSSKDDIFISPRLMNEKESLSGIFKHELSHIHLRQYVGSWTYVYGIPAWFKEGLAVVTSDGAGAEGVTDKEAIFSILDGQHFNPEEGTGVFNLKHAHDYGLKPHMFYRQAGLFVSFLKDINEPAFKKSYMGLISGEEFEEVWLQYYDRSIAKLWEEFISKIKA